MSPSVICIDYNVAGKWAEDRNIPYTSYPELSQKPEVYDLVLKQIVKMNKGLPDVAKIQRFVNLYKEFDADDEELTRTRKIRRAFVEKRYQDIVEAIYDGKGQVHMDTTITYEDGREVKIKADMRRGGCSQGGGLMEFFLQLLITGVMVGSIYALVALGWTLIYKCSGVLNLAMGELTLIGAYVSLSFYNWGVPFLTRSARNAGHRFYPGSPHGKDFFAAADR